MTVAVSEYVSVAERAGTLNCNVPEGFAVLPANFESAETRDQLIFDAQAGTLRTLLRNEGLQITDLIPAIEGRRSVHNKSSDWAAVLFVSASMLSADPTAVSVAIGILSNYLTTYFQGRSTKDVKLELVIEKQEGRTCKKLTYEGPIEGLSSIEEAIKRLADE